jgi:hypothetical protein
MKKRYILQYNPHRCVEWQDNPFHHQAKGKTAILVMKKMQ